MEKNGKKIVIVFLVFINTMIKTVFFVPRGTCRFYPSCSNYAKQALATLPLFRACFLILLRILKCNPFTKPGYDPVPNPMERRQCCE
jgi:putative membrane protein insertion efficiency factor